MTIDLQRTRTELLSILDKIETEVSETTTLFDLAPAIPLLRRAITNIDNQIATTPPIKREVSRTSQNEHNLARYAITSI